MADIGLLDGKTVIVTGAGKGIGAASAICAASEGARVVLAGTTLEALENVAEEISAKGGEAAVYRVDVSAAADVQALVDYVIERYGRLDGAYNNAGIDGPLAPTADYPEDEFDRVIAVNLKGVWNCLRFQIPAMLDSGGGAIVNCCSALGEVGQYQMPAYCASKAGVLGLTRTAALDYGQQGIRVNAISPGVVETPMMTAMMERIPGLREQLLNSEPIGRLGRSEEIAESVVWLLSDRATFALGANVVVDGGYLSR